VDYVESYYFAFEWPEILLGLGLLAFVLLGVWKLAKLAWAALSG
jgi:hypothetical protein